MSDSRRTAPAKKKSKRAPASDKQQKELSPLDPMRVALPTSPPQKEPGLLVQIWNELPPKKRTEYALIGGCVVFMLITAALIPVFFDGKPKTPQDDNPLATMPMPMPTGEREAPTPVVKQPVQAPTPPTTAQPYQLPDTTKLPPPKKIPGGYRLAAEQFFANPKAYVDKTLEVWGKLTAVGQSFVNIVVDSGSAPPKIICTKRPGGPSFIDQGLKPGDITVMRGRYTLPLDRGEQMYPFDDCEWAK